MNLSKQLTEIARQAGKIIMGFYEGGAGIEIKKDKTPVTEADITANDFIVKKLKKLTPDIPIVAEESENTQDAGESGKFWLVDPLDGTKSFIKKTGEFTVNIGLIDNGVPTIGVIYIPARDEMYFTGEDGKAYKQEGGGKPYPIEVRTPPEAGLSVVASQSHRTPETDAFIENLPKVEKLVSASSSLKLCLLAEGKADVYPRFGPTCEWDIAAGHAILQAAGGSLTTETGKKFAYGKPDYLNGYFIAWGKK